MNRNGKLATGVILLAVGTGLICWNLRDPNAAYREGPKEERVVTARDVPLPVQATVQRIAAGQRIREIKERRQNGMTTYHVDMIHGNIRHELRIAEDGSVLKQKSKKVKPPRPAKPVPPKPA
jgi:hypothetical protein